jgi:hypothetical protein
VVQLCDDIRIVSLQVRFEAKLYPRHHSFMRVWAGVLLTSSVHLSGFLLDCRV